MQILSANNKRSFIGEHFAADDVPVRAKLNNHAMWIGNSSTTPMLAVVNGPANDNAKEVRPSSLINARGTAEKAPFTAQAKREWGLTAADAA